MLLTFDDDANRVILKMTQKLCLFDSLKGPLKPVILYEAILDSHYLLLSLLPFSSTRSSFHLSGRVHPGDAVAILKSAQAIVMCNARQDFLPSAPFLSVLAALHSGWLQAPSP